MEIIGLTGGIGSGKTLASNHFERIGIDIIDTDIIARKVVEPGQPALQALIDRFGENIVDGNGALIRDRMREVAFSSPENKAALDSITHPAIRTQTLHEIAQAEGVYCIVVVPLLTQHSPFMDFMERVIAVIADRELKIQRVMTRNNFDREQVLAIMNTQLDDDQRLEFADDIIQNNSSKEQVYQRVEELHKEYLTLFE